MGGGVGKTSLVLRFIQGTFRDSYVPTIEDAYRKVISSKTQNSPPAVCTLHITDTTGSHQFPAMQRLSISKGHAFILVFSISSRQSLEELKPILEVIGEVKGSMEGFPLLLVGNKCDEEAGKRQVSAKTGEALEKMWKVKFLETSAKKDININELFEEIFKLEKSRDLSLQQRMILTKRGR